DIYKVGGAQAIAAMAYGTETIPKCHKIFGPGNRYVMGAKMKVSSDTCSIDMPAGPSEVLVACDSSANPAFVAADLLSQGEHGPDSQTVMAFAGSKEEFVDFANKVDFQLDKQLSGLGRASIASKALENSFAVFGSREEVTAFINSYAPEHLILNLEEPMSIMDKVENAGSVFIGPWSCESAGDYASGTNHTLPTSLWAKSCSGVNTDSFMKHITYQTLSKEGLKNLGNTIMTMAYAEGLQGHGDAVKIRLKEDI
ncbi:MAG: histidinol dehydrogenase, partial [Sphaerochaetaceae bacterium]|nr:histidinol dehydrogenase [Sphaerochaetaceae bacterium]